MRSFLIAINAASRPTLMSTVSTMPVIFFLSSVTNAKKNLMVVAAKNARTSFIFPRKNKKRSGLVLTREETCSTNQKQNTRKYSRQGNSRYFANCLLFIAYFATIHFKQTGLPTRILFPVSVSNPVFLSLLKITISSLF